MNTVPSAAQLRPRSTRARSSEGATSVAASFHTMREAPRAAARRDRAKNSSSLRARTESDGIDSGPGPTAVRISSAKTVLLDYMCNIIARPYA